MSGIGWVGRNNFQGDASMALEDPYAKFRRNTSIGYRGDAIMG